MLYRAFFWLVLRRIPAEQAHKLSFGLLRILAAIPGMPALMRRVCHVRDPRLRVSAFGRELSNPLGLAAGFDKEAHGVTALAAVGFGFVEVGTITAQPQPGNPQPRLFRLPADRALVNRMGFNNAGSSAAAEALSRHPRAAHTTLGVNIGKTKVVSEADAIADYVDSTRALAPHADYLVVNVSSPNTPGLRNLQTTALLRPLLTAVAEAGAEVTASGACPPLLVKIAPDLADDDVDDIARLALELNLDGIIATNTTIKRSGLRSSAEQIEAAGVGGLSGAPLRDRSLEVLRRLRAVVGDRLVLVSVGGIETADDAWQRLCAGATLVQGYTGLIYGGPLWPRAINKGLLRRLDAAGLPNIEAARGCYAS